MEFITRILKDTSVFVAADAVVTVIVLAMPDACTRLLSLSLLLYGYYRGQNMTKGNMKESAPIKTPDRSDSPDSVGRDSGFSSLSLLSGSAERLLVKDDYLEDSITTYGKSTPEQHLTKDSGIKCFSNHGSCSRFVTSTAISESELITYEEEIESLNLEEDPEHTRSSMSGNQLDPILEGDPVSITHQLDAILKTHLEEMVEFNIDLQELIEKALNILSKKRDGAIIELKQSMGQEFSKLKDQTRRTRNAFKLEARRQLNSEVAEEVINKNLAAESPSGI